MRAVIVSATVALSDTLGVNVVPPVATTDTVTDSLTLAESLTLTCGLLGEMAHVDVTQYDEPSVVDTPVSVPALVIVSYWTDRCRAAVGVRDSATCAR